VSPGRAVLGENQRGWKARPDLSDTSNTDQILLGGGVVLGGTSPAARSPSPAWSSAPARMRPLGANATVTSSRLDVGEHHGVGAALLAASAVASAAPESHPRSRAAAGPGKHAPVLLPFKASSLTGISEKMIASHHDKNYAGAVKALNGVETDLAALKPNAPGYLVAGLRERELLFANSITLHAHYFGNLGRRARVRVRSQSRRGAGGQRSVPGEPLSGALRPIFA
jgi:hypothetical protein